MSETNDATTETVRRYWADMDNVIDLGDDEYEPTFRCQLSVSASDYDAKCAEVERLKESNQRRDRALEEACARLKQLDARIAELEDRLEVYATNEAGERIRVGCDGIAARDETICLLDARVSSLERDAARWQHAIMHGFPVRNQTDTNSRRWIAFTNDKTFFGGTAHEALDAAIDSQREGA